MWILKYDTNEHIYKTDSQTWRTDLWLPRVRAGGGSDWEFRTNRYKLLFIGWINKVQRQYSTSCDKHREKNMKYICVYIFIYICIFMYNSVTLSHSKN